MFGSIAPIASIRDLFLGAALERVLAGLRPKSRRGPYPSYDVRRHDDATAIRLDRGADPRDRTRHLDDRGFGGRGAPERRRPARGDRSGPHAHRHLSLIHISEPT